MITVIYSWGAPEARLYVVMTANYGDFSLLKYTGSSVASLLVRSQPCCSSANLAGIMRSPFFRGYAEALFGMGDDWPV
ncbi:MAG: hypothetical protein ACI8R9_000623 [Paraglaciecola sp.]|jgi:hypothetical protein